ncbi:MAG: toll/interleukin-1 receptor domain-containing protein [Proteobacteria bacterium]|nr:toll/interleukin-1 receptor domain-containing protein [Pseudomonadota bacterium]
MGALNGAGERQSLDFFLSYKSEDVAIVRMIAEQMRASGAKVWFAEYDIRLESRDQFMEDIESAIDNCRFGICFTNDHFTDSQYCRKEVELLLNRLGPERIVEIALPRQPLPHRLFPDLSAAMCLEVPVSQSIEKNLMESGQERSTMLSCRAVDSILEHIQKSTGVLLSGCDCQTAGELNRRGYRSRGVGYSLDFTGWTLERPGCLARLIGWGEGDSLGPMFSRACSGGRLWGHLIVGKQDVARKKLKIGTNDDREYYDEALKFARHYYGKIWKQNCMGVHLLFLEGFSHPAFTTLARSGITVVMGNAVWSRLYSVVLKGRWRWSSEKEFAFFFFFRGDLASFLRSAHIMDRLVLSFKRKVQHMSPEVDRQTQSIIEYFTKHQPQYLHQIQWMRNPLVRLVDLLLFGLIGKVLLSLGRKTSGPRAIDLLSKAIAVSSSKKVIAKALFYRGNSLFDGAADADNSIADYSLAIWCDPNDCWARKDRATIYEMYHASYGRGDSSFTLPMTHAGACADLETAIAYFRSLANSHPSPKGKDHAIRMMRQCEAVLQKLEGHSSG